MQDDRSMRRALAARPRLARNFRAGDIVAYWRDQKWVQGKLSKGGRWYGSAVVIGHIGKNVVLAHRSHVLRCAPEQVRLATSEEKQLIDTPDTQLLGIKDMLEGGTFRSAQYVDLLHQAYPPSEDVVMQEVPQASGAPEVVPSVPDADLSALSAAAPEAPAMPETVNDDIRIDDDVVPSPASVVVTPPSPERTEMAVEPPAAAEASSGSAGPRAAAENEPSTYGPLRRVPTKTGPMALFRPMPMQHDDFVDVLSEVLPQMIEDAVHSSKRSAPASEAEPAAKMSKTEQLSVQHVQGDPFALTSEDARELWASLQQRTPHEVLVAQFLQKRMQKELPHSNNEPALQAQIDAAKTLEWNTLSEKNAVRLLSVSESEWVKKHRANRIMGSRFVLTKKAMEDIVENGLTPDNANPDHWKVKARWCLQGHLDPDLTSKAQAGLLQSPTLSQMGRMVLFQLLATHRWTLQLGDIKGAFLEAGPLNPRYRPLYAWLPAGGLPGADTAQLVEVLGNVYGQNDAPASWYKVFDDEVLKTGFIRSKYDPCLYYLRNASGKLCGILGSHVDDTVTGGQGPEYKMALEQLRRRFPYRKWRISEGEFCGAHYKQNPQSMEITMNQCSFAQGLKPAYLPARRRLQRSADLDPKEVSVLRAINGSLNWLSNQSRPDLAAQTSLSQQAMSAPKVHHLCEVNNIIRRAKQHAELSILFKAIPAESLRLVCHSDAAFANVGVYTQAGFVIGFTDAKLDDGHLSSWTPAVWKSAKLSRAVGSTLAAESQSMVNATGTLEWTALLLAEALDGPFDVRNFETMLKRRPPVVVTDCKSLFDHLISVSSPTSVEDRRTSIDVVILRQSLQRLAASIRWVPTDRMIADSLTKDAGDPTDLLRACIRQGTYQISPEETVLKLQAEEKQRRLEKRNTKNTVSLS
eukprot:s1599_g7.t1